MRDLSKLHNEHAMRFIENVQGVRYESLINRIFQRLLSLDPEIWYLLYLSFDHAKIFDP